MRFSPTKIPGAFQIDLDLIEDERGFFARSWCAREFGAIGLSTACVQRSISYNRVRGILRGIHFQAKPHEENKLVQVIRGAIFDVLVDLRPESPSFGTWEAFELTAHNHRGVYIPSGVGHGFQTLENDTEVSYQMSEYYFADLARGVRWDDMALAITWPVSCPTISARDQAWPTLAALGKDDA